MTTSNPTAEDVACNFAITIRNYDRMIEEALNRKEFDKASRMMDAVHEMRRTLDALRSIAR